MAHKRKMSAKQIRYFGSKRQKAGLRKRRHNAAPKRRNPVRATKRNTAKKSNPRHHHHKRRNPIPEIISLTMGNPARKKEKYGSQNARQSRNESGTRRPPGEMLEDTVTTTNVCTTVITVVIRPASGNRWTGSLAAWE